MSSDHRERLRNIRTFPSLIKYLRDEMDWPISSEDFEELTFDYTTEELGIDTKTAAKIQEIKRLRPLYPNQPWGIFFVKFEPKQLPVVVLRRLLSRVVVKKRASANKADRVAWEAGDLLFISNYGEGKERQITFAHFSEQEKKSNLPTLKVLGWDNQNTPLHLDHVAKELTNKLRWPNDERDSELWRKAWRSAFSLKPKEVIKTSKSLALHLAELARAIRDRINTILAVETENGPVTKLMDAFKETLIHDLNNDGFADMYAQTIAYGLLSARVANPLAVSEDDVTKAMPVTNPFLKELVKIFLDVGSRKCKEDSATRLDFDELGVNEVVELLDAANMEAVLLDFGDRNPQEDPVIHFYELFLKEYDAKKRMQRGVFYTPRPVVSFIVRSVDELLRTEFGLEDGLADTTTWGEIIERFDDLEIPEDISSDQAFVQILDPATGTGTFLVEVVDRIHKTMMDKWQAEGNNPKKIEQLWNEYVPQHLLPRLHGYELMMAPYAIAHMKMGLKLYETGYHYASDERARIYLTNALEPMQDFSGTLAFAIPAIAHEVKAVNSIKKNQRFTVIIGNPPYSYMSANLGEQVRNLVDPYRYVDGTRMRERGAISFERAIQDDYVKFLAYAQFLLEQAKIGLLGMITNASYMDNPTMRGMRCSLCNSYKCLSFVHLHGDSKRDPTTDENVFDIQTGVSVIIGRRLIDVEKNSCSRTDLLGSRSTKYSALKNMSIENLDSTQLHPESDDYMFTIETAIDKEYRKWISIDDIFCLTSVAIKTNRDHLLIDFDDQPIRERVQKFCDLDKPDDEIREELQLRDNVQWNLAKARKECKKSYDKLNFKHLNYRPFDNRRIYYHSSVVSQDRPRTMNQMLGEDNIALLTVRRIRTSQHEHFFVTKRICMAEMLSSADNCNIYPLYQISNETELFGGDFHSTISTEVFSKIKSSLGLKIVPVGKGNLSSTLGPQDLFHWIYSIVHSRNYRDRYQNMLRNNYPRVPLPDGKIQFFKKMCDLGADLVSLHLFESPKLDNFVTEEIGSCELKIEIVSYSDETVWINKAKTCGFRGVTEEVWDFRIGSYQVCEKWLKDRQAKGGKNPRSGQVLMDDDINHYQKIIVALSETIRIMTEIDKTIDAHGGWPAAFIGKDKDSINTGGLSSEILKVAEDRSSYEKRHK